MLDASIIITVVLHSDKDYKDSPCNNNCVKIMEHKFITFSMHVFILFANEAKQSWMTLSSSSHH